MVLARGGARRRCRRALRIAEATTAPPRRARPRARCGQSSEIVVVSGAYELDVEERTVSTAPTGSEARARRSAAASPRSPPRSKLRSSCSPTGPSSRRRRSERVIDGLARHRRPTRRGLLRRLRAATRCSSRASCWDDVPDEGLRAREPLLVPCDDLGAPGDVDYPEDLPSA